MSEKQRYPYNQAFAVADALCGLLEESCERVVVAGSLRRKRVDVGDIEILAVPKPSDNMFFSDELDRTIKGLIHSGILMTRLSTKGQFTYGPKNKLLVHVPSGIPLDVFSADVQNWGMSLFVRTGPADWNIKAMATFKAKGMSGHAYGGVTGRNGQEEECPTEQRVFDLLGWPYVEPEARR